MNYLCMGDWLTQAVLGQELYVEEMTIFGVDIWFWPVFNDFRNINPLSPPKNKKK